ncbi:helix-turn-helix transcriptional regulator [Kitasatospora sp. GAS204B]|uniref:helix-turn-helix domain-containing protein n=1 Tax=unclassified Kitasatospora TaxID=2633591 RepID=UPI002474AED4|nr:helix-turn-helix transcriptional regulator [Kitasatospora sp. GAS204B]MDH6118080.1 transcriptional regulator with XRE-family HTH domain [Kitasatospora sp. GAS204B]
MPAPKELDPTISLEHYLGNQVRKRREAKGLTQKQLGQMIFVSHNRIAQIELATDPPGPHLIVLLDAALDAQGDLIELWGHLGLERVDDYARLFLMRQGQARIIQEYGLVIPGLVQTEDYVRAMFTAGEAVGEPPVAGKLPIRLARQRIFDREDPPWYRLTLDESALYRNVGGRAVMGAELLHLLELGKRPRVEIQVVPFGALDLNALGGSLCLLTMPDGSRAAYTEGLHTGRFFEDAEKVARFTLVYDRIQAAALDPEMSAAFIRNVMEERYAWDLPPLA